MTEAERAEHQRGEQSGHEQLSAAFAFCCRTAGLAAFAEHPHFGKRTNTKWKHKGARLVLLLGSVDWVPQKMEIHLNSKGEIQQGELRWGWDALHRLQRCAFPKENPQAKEKSLGYISLG